MKIRNKNKIFFSVLLISLLLSLVLVPALAFAQEEEEPDTIDIVESIRFDSTFPELMAKGGVPFNFNIDLTYQGIEEKVFNLRSEKPDSWFVAIQPSYEQVEISAIKLTPGRKESLKVTAVPLVSMEPGEYDIKVFAENEGLEAVIELKATVTSTYEHAMTTATGRLDTKVTAGKDNNYIIKLQNNGSAAIENLSLTSTAPEGWRIRFTPEKIETFNAGETKDVNVVIYPPEKTIAGDYMVTLRSSSENSNKSLDLRVTVLTPTIWGWVGIAVIVIVIIGIAIIFARLGRR